MIDRSEPPVSWHSRSLATTVLVMLTPVGAALGQEKARESDAATEVPVAAEWPFPPADPQSVGLDPQALDALAGVVERWVDEDRVVGAELLVVQSRRTVLHRAFGWLDRELQRPMLLNTRFNLRSMTKTLTGAAVQILLDEGKIELEDQAAVFLPSFDREGSDAITVEQLLEHRSGLPLTMVTESVRQYRSLRAMADAAGEHGPDTEPGQRFWYSDAGTEVLGAIVEVVSGQSLDRFVEEHLLTPIGMHDTDWAHDLDDAARSRIASLYFGSPGSWTKIWSAEAENFYPYAWGSQSLYGTTTDYARFLAMWMDGGMAGQERVLSTEAVERTLTPVSEMTALGSEQRFPTFFAELEVYYGQMAVLYCRTEAELGTPAEVIGHSGSDGTIAWAWPQRDLMVLYFTQSRGQATPIQLEADIDRLLLHPGADSEGEIPKRLLPYLGPYQANFAPFHGAVFTVLVQNGHLAVDVPGQIVWELREPDAAGRWVFALSDGIAVSFDEETAGVISAMRLYQAGQELVLPRGNAEAEVTLSAKFLAPYLGRYRDEGNDVDIELIDQRGRLAAKAPGLAAPLEFFPPDEDGFWVARANPVLKIRFQRDAEQHIVSYTVVGPGGESVRPRIQSPHDGAASHSP